MPLALGRLVPRLARRNRAAAGAARSARANARRAVLWALAVAALATVGFSVVLEAAAPTLRDPEHGHRMAALRAARGPERPLVVFIGSSWTQNAIDPAAMPLGDGPGAPRGFNYGLGGTLPPYLPVVARRLWDADVRPAALVVEVFPVLLRFDDTCETKFAASGAGLTLPDLIRLTPATTRPAVHTRWLEARLNPWYTYRHELVGRVDPRWLSWEARGLIATRPPDANGYSPFADTPDDVRARRANRLAHMRSAHGGAAADLHISERSRRAYRELVDDCRARGVPVAFYLTAESPTFRAWYGPRSLEAVAAFVRFLSDELGCPVFVPRAADFSEDDFGDGIHMVPRGATKYSRWLADAHLRPWLTSAVRGPSSSP